MSKESMEIRIGPPVMGANYFPRALVSGNVLDGLKAGHVRITGPRRTGKTSVLLNLHRYSPSDDRHLFLNLEKLDTPADWIEALAAEALRDPDHPANDGKLVANVKRLGSGIIEKLRKIEDIEIKASGVKIRSGEDHWKKAADRILSVLTASPNRVVFLIDEFPVFIDHLARRDRDEARLMLGWFREWRQRLAREENESLRFVVTGSVGLDGIVSRHGLHAEVIDLQPIEFPPLSREEAFAFLQKLGLDNSLTISRKQAEAIVDHVGQPWPYFLQIFVDGIRQWAIEKGSPPSDDAIEKVYQRYLIGGIKNTYGPDMLARLTKVCSNLEDRIARAILKRVAASDDGLGRDTFEHIHAGIVPDPDERNERDLDFVLQTLKHDGYLHQDVEGDHRTRFASNVLRDWWRLHYA